MVLLGTSRTATQETLQHPMPRAVELAMARAGLSQMVVATLFVLVPVGVQDVLIGAAMSFL